MVVTEREELESARALRKLPKRAVREVEDEGAFQEAHEFAGRTSNWPMGCVTFCSCGAAFYRDDVAESDRAYNVHAATRRDGM